MSEASDLDIVGFWTWLVRKDRDGDRGANNVLNAWLLFHIAVGGAGIALMQATSQDLARFIALPGAALMVGLSFGWAGRSAGLLQDKEFSAFIIRHGPPPECYVYSFQLAILCVLGFVGSAAVIAGGGLPISLGVQQIDEGSNRFLMFFLGSIAIRECWGTIDFVNKMTIQFYLIRKKILEDESLV